MKAPPQAAHDSSWSGFYIGAHVGYGYAVTAINAPDLALTSRIIGAGSKGFVAGGLGGYNYMLSSRWVGGIEIDGSWQDIKSKRRLYLRRRAQGVDGLVGVGARQTRISGDPLDDAVRHRWMVVELARYQHQSKRWRPHRAALRQSISGPQAGFGVETMWTENWLVRTEYLQSFYDRVEFNTTVFNGGPSPVTFSPWVGVIRTALIYKPGIHPDGLARSRAHGDLERLLCRRHDRSADGQRKDQCADSGRDGRWRRRVVGHAVLAWSDTTS